MTLNAQPSECTDPNIGVDQALPRVLEEISKAVCALALSNAMSSARHGDRQRLGASLEAMRSDQLVEASAAAQLLSAEADQVLKQRGAIGHALPSDVTTTHL